MAKYANNKAEIIRTCRQSYNSYITRQKFMKDSIRRRDVIRSMIESLRDQLDTLIGAEAVLSRQIDENSDKLEKELNDYGRKK